MFSEAEYVSLKGCKSHSPEEETRWQIVRQERRKIQQAAKTLTLTLQPMHFEVIFQLLLCGPDAATTPVVCTSGLEIEFYPNLTPE